MMVSFSFFLYFFLTCFFSHINSFVRVSSSVFASIQSVNPTFHCLLSCIFWFSFVLCVQYNIFWSSGALAHTRPHARTHARTVFIVTVASCNTNRLVQCKQRSHLFLNSPFTFSKSISTVFSLFSFYFRFYQSVTFVDMSHVTVHGHGSVTIYSTLFFFPCLISI